MQRHPLAFLFVASLLLAACSSPQSRITENKTAYDQFPPHVQQLISAGRIEIGFTEEMVRMALGEPDRRFTRKTEAGEIEVWGYHEHHSRVSFGFGFGSAGPHSAVGAGVGMASGGDDPEEKTRIEFRGGQVAAINYFHR